MLKVTEMLGGGLVMAGLVLAAGCATDDGSSADEPIAQIALEGGGRVMFFEPSPGALEVAQIAPKSVAMRGELRAVDLYASLAPGRPVPDALLAAQRRFDASRAEHGETLVATPQLDVGPTTTSSWIDNKTIDDHWFHDHRCGYDELFFFDYPDVDHCKVNLDKDSPTSASSSNFNDTDHTVVTACADVGSVTLMTLAPVFHQWDLFEGDCVNYWWSSGWQNTTAASQVVNVNAANRYHYSARYWD